MIGAASSLDGHNSGDALTHVDRATVDTTKSRAVHRRHAYAAQVASYVFGTVVLLIYAHAGTIPVGLPPAFFLSGVTLIGIFAALSEARINDRFEDHYLTVFQLCGHAAIQFGFLLAAPEIGFA